MQNKKGRARGIVDIFAMFHYNGNISKIMEYNIKP